MLHLHLSDPDDPALEGLAAALAETVPLRRSVFRAGWRGAATRFVRRAGRRMRSGLTAPRVYDSPPKTTVLLTSPDQAALLPTLDDRVRVVYYAKDNFAVGYDWAPESVTRWEARIVDRSHTVVAVSRSLADALRERHDLPADRMLVSPNAVPASVIPATCPTGPRTLPSWIPEAPGRPVAGVLGRISSRIRLEWLRIVVDRSPWLHWLFVGDVEKGELRPDDLEHLAWLRGHRRCHFAGRRSYQELCEVAAAVDVAVLPYSRASINPWSSPMRLFLHLPFGRPMVATPGCPQVEGFEPLVTTCRSPGALAAALETLADRDFDDHLGRERWRASSGHTWACRAAELVHRLGVSAGAAA